MKTTNQIAINFCRKNEALVDNFFKTYKPHGSEQIKRNYDIFLKFLSKHWTGKYLAEIWELPRPRITQIVNKYANKIYYHYQ